MKVDSLKDVSINSEVALKRHMGLFSGVCYIICIIIGKHSSILVDLLRDIFLIRFRYIRITERSFARHGISRFMFNYLDRSRPSFSNWFVSILLFFIIEHMKIYFIGALCYAEIGTLIPRNGAETAYFKEGKLDYYITEASFLLLRHRLSSCENW